MWEEGFDKLACFVVVVVVPYVLPLLESSMQFEIMSVSMPIVAQYTHFHGIWTQLPLI